MKPKSFFVLMFHGIVKESPAYFTYRPNENCFVRETDFDKIISDCKKRYKILRLNDLGSYFDGSATQDGVLISFDDGLQSLYNLGLPILKKHNANATVFITSDWTNKGIAPAIFSLEYQLFYHTPAIVKISCNGFLFNEKITHSKEAGILISALWDKLFLEKTSPLSLGYEHIILNGKTLNSFVKETDPDYWKPMSWQLLLEANRDGLIEIGAHGKTHTPFDWLSAQQLEQECIESKQQVLQHLGIDVTTCSFPHGSYNERLLEIIGSHFNYAFTNKVVEEDRLGIQLAISRFNVPYQRPNSIPSLIRYPFIGKILRKIGYITKLY